MCRLRVRPETLSGVAEFSEHEADGSKLEEGEGRAVEVLPVLGQSPAAVEPGDRALDDPALGERDEALDPIRAFDDHGFEMRQDAGQRGVKDRPRVGAVGEQFFEIGEQAEQRRQQSAAAVTILNVGGGDDGVQEQALGIDENVPLLALDQLARIKAGRIAARPPFSALFTLWLSMMQAVGLVSRSAFSRHLT